MSSKSPFLRSPGSPLSVIVSVVPVATRYAYSANPLGANLYDREGFPASPFRSDDW